MAGAIQPRSDPADQPGNEQVAFWNEIMVPKFVRWKHIIVDGLKHHSARVLPTLPVKEGDRIVDIGCGFGGTSIALAEKVGPTGSVLGIDCCNAFLEYARRDAKAAGLKNVEFVEADVEVYHFRPEFDFWFSRFGTMFFRDPVQTLRDLRSALKPGGAMVMIVWRDIEDNPWVHIPKQVALRYLPPPGGNRGASGPGPFSMADPDLVASQLMNAGHTEIEFERIDAPLLVGRTPDEAVELQLSLGPAAEILREAGEAGERRRDEIAGALKSAIVRYSTPEGVLMPSSSWRVSARNPT